MRKPSPLFLYLILTSLFIAALATTNLIASKFVSVDLYFYTFEISAGILPYPVTFLMTDLLSEIYGQRRARHVVLGGFVASLFVLFILWLGDQFPALSFSPVDDETYYTVFAKAPRVIASSMIAYLIAQLVDVRIYHFWMEKTQGRMLWLRNNASTITSQLVDTTLVVAILFYDELSVREMGVLILHGWAFKSIVALFDTPVLYILVYQIRKWFNLGANQQLSLEPNLDEK